MEVVEFQIRDEITDWFERLINEKYGSDIHLRYLEDGAHFNMYTRVEISGTESQLDDAVEFIRNTSDELEYKMLWISDNVYYTRPKCETESVNQVLKDILSLEDTFNSTEYNLIGAYVNAFNFRLINTEMKDIDEIFKNITRGKEQFIILPPKSRVQQNQSLSNMSTNILTAFHGKFLKYLSLEDVLSLELANKIQDSCYDESLDHDIQMYLQCNLPDYYTGEKNQVFIADGFKLSEVVQYFIQKYHHCLANCLYPAVLTANEIQSLSRIYKIEMVWHKLIHIDFKNTNESNVCAIYHSTPNVHGIHNCDAKYATENHTIIFNRDDSLNYSDQSTTEFIFMALKSQNNCTPQQTKSILKWVTKHFRPALQNKSELVLSKFDLKQVSSEILNDLLSGMRQAEINFYKMNFNLKTLSTILEQSDQNMFLFRNCQILTENVERISNISGTNTLLFHEMDIELNIFSVLMKIDYLLFKYCRILSSSWGTPINKKIANKMIFFQNKFDTLTLLRLLHMLQNTDEILFKVCDIAACDLTDMRHFAVRNTIHFRSMSINIKTLFQILEYCQSQNGIGFDCCHFYYENDSSYKCSLKPVNSLLIYKTYFDLLTLITILETLHNKSKVWLEDCTILFLDENIDISNKCIKLECIQFKGCCLDTSALFVILEISNATDFTIESCEFIASTWEREIDMNTVPTMQEQLNIEFRNMTIIPQIARLFLLSDDFIIFNNCDLNFMTDEFSDIPIVCKAVSFRNVKFDLSKHAKSLANFSSETAMFFENCRFESNGPSILDVTLTPVEISFKRTTFDRDLLIRILENISEQTGVSFIECRFPAINRVSSRRQIQIKNLQFTEMSLTIRTILSVLKNFPYLEHLWFTNCMLESNPNELDIAFNHNVVLSTESVTLKHLLFKDVKYSPNILQILKHLNEICIVDFMGPLSNEAIIEFCTKTHVHGKQLWLNAELCMKTIYFELIAELARPLALNFGFDPKMEYDLPTHILPVINSLDCESQRDWNAIKMKFVLVNDATVKIQFLKDGRPIDLFFELNDLTDDSDEFIVDYS